MHPPSALSSVPPARRTRDLPYPCFAAMKGTWNLGYPSLSAVRPPTRRRSCYASRMDISSVNAALEIISKVSKGLNSVRERAKTSKDSDLKESISNLYDDFIDLKAVIVNLTDENAELRQKIARTSNSTPKPQIRTVGQTNYYYVGEDGPYCQPCYDKDKRLAVLSPLQQNPVGDGRKCNVCTQFFYETRKRQQQMQIRTSPWS